MGEILTQAFLQCGCFIPLLVAVKFMKCFIDAGIPRRIVAWTFFLLVAAYAVIILLYLAFNVWNLIFGA